MAVEEERGIAVEERGIAVEEERGIAVEAESGTLTGTGPVVVVEVEEERGKRAAKAALFVDAAEGGAQEMKVVGVGGMEDSSVSGKETFGFRGGFVIYKQIPAPNFSSLLAFFSLSCAP
jgi:hypothetical protein